MKRIFWTLANAQGAESSKFGIFDVDLNYGVNCITKSDVIAVYFYIREGKRDRIDISNFLGDDKTKAYVCIMTLFENGFIQPEIEEDEMPEGYHENFSAIPKLEFDNVGK